MLVFTHGSPILFAGTLALPFLRPARAMFSSIMKPSSSKYRPLSRRANSDASSSTPERRLSEEDSSAALLETLDNLPAQAPPRPPLLPRLVLYLSFALALLSAANIALLPATLSKYRDSPLSDSELDALPFGDARLGLDKVANLTPQIHHRAWPDKIVRVSRKLKKAVWGQGVQVYVTVEVRTLPFLFAAEHPYAYFPCPTFPVCRC